MSPVSTVSDMRMSHWIIASLVVIILCALILFAMGRVPVCECGYVKLWHGTVISSENSQHISDWYTPSHVIHGLFFYAILLFIARKLPLGARLFIAVVLEAGWEILENTDLIINRYREATISLDYYGDSISNSTFDIFAMLLGFYLARKLPLWASVGLVFVFELFTTLMIRDGLIINIIMLVRPMEIILNWQAGA